MKRNVDYFTEINLGFTLWKFYDRAYGGKYNPFYEKCLVVILKFYSGQRIGLAIPSYYSTAKAEAVITKMQRLGNDVRLASDIEIASSPISSSLRLMRKFALYFGLPPTYQKCQTTGIWYLVSGVSSNFYLGEPFEVSLKGLYKRKVLSDAEHEDIFAAIDFVKTSYGSSVDKKQSISRALQIIQSGKPLMFFHLTSGHVRSIVVHQNKVYECDRAHTDSVIVRTLTKSIDSTFLNSLLTPISDFDKLLPAYTSNSAPKIVRSMGAQYTGNCSAQSWLLGLWAVFNALGISQVKYREFTKSARQYLWEEALKDSNLVHTMFIASVNQPIGTMQATHQVTPRILLALFSNNKICGLCGRHGLSDSFDLSRQVGKTKRYSNKRY